jgi:ketosteroid isomerase-like protein
MVVVLLEADEPTALQRCDNSKGVGERDPAGLTAHFPVRQDHDAFAQVDQFHGLQGVLAAPPQPWPRRTGDSPPARDTTVRQARLSPTRSRAIFKLGIPADHDRLQIATVVGPSIAATMRPSPASLPPDVEWDSLAGPLVGVGTIRGREAMLKFLWEDIPEGIESFRASPEEFTELGNDRVLVSGLFQGRGGSSDIEVNIRVASIYKIRDGLVATVRDYGSRMAPSKPPGGLAGFAPGASSLDLATRSRLRLTPDRVRANQPTKEARCAQSSLRSRSAIMTTRNAGSPRRRELIPVDQAEAASRGRARSSSDPRGIRRVSAARDSVARPLAAATTPLQARWQPRTPGL